MFAADPLHVFRGESDDQIGGLEVIAGDLLAPMMTCFQSDVPKGLSGAPTDGLTIDAESSRGHHLKAWFTSDESGPGHHRSCGIAGADDEK